MFEIFGALLGGGYLLYKYTSDKHSNKAFKRQQASKAAIRKKVSDLVKECEMREKMFYTLPRDVENGTVKLTPELHQKLKDDVINMRYDIIHNIIPTKDMEYVFGEDWENIFMSYPTDYESLRDLDSSNFMAKFGDIWEIVFNIWFSTYGYIAYDHTDSGYRYKMGIRGVPHEDTIQVASRACQIIERNLLEKYDNDGFKLYVSSIDDSKLIWEYESPEFIGNRLW